MDDVSGEFVAHTIDQGGCSWLRTLVKSKAAGAGTAQLRVI